MKFTSVVSAIAAFAGLASAGIPMPVCEAPVTSLVCTYEPIVPIPKHFHCNEMGIVTKPVLVTGKGCLATDFDQCRDFCMDVPDCHSFGFHAASRQCNMYRLGLTHQKWEEHDKDHGWVYSNSNHCYKRTCPLGLQPKFPKGMIGNKKHGPNKSSGILDLGWLKGENKQ